MKKHKKGFSLIELLAVIIILAILALITIPIVSNLIKQAKINSAVVSAYGYVEAANNAIVTKQTKGENVAEIQYDIEESNLVGDSLNIKYEGKGPVNGWFVISKNKVTEGEFCINGYDIKYEDGIATYIQDGEVCPGAPLPPLENLCADSKDPEPDKEYAIRYIEDLVCLSQKVNSGKNFQGTTVVLEKDLDFNNTSSYKSGVVDTILTTGTGFTPIGNEAHPFNGDFIGNGNTISNLKINVSSNNVGFFGYTSTNAKIIGLNLYNPNVTGRQNTGSLIGYQNGGEVVGINADNITVNGSGQLYIGGLIGYSAGIVNEVVVEGSITGGTCVGGIIGSHRGSVKKSLYARNVNVTGSLAVAGIFGDEDQNIGIYGAIENGSITDTMGTAGKVGANYSTYTGLLYSSTSVTKTGNGGIDGKSYDRTKNIIGMLDDVIDTYIGGDSDDSGFILDYETPTSSKIVVKKLDNNLLKISLRGEGTQDKPYLLETEQDFKDASLLGKGNYFYKINNNIDFGTFNKIYPLGTEKNYFSGVIDGNNKTITNINIVGGKYTGLIGYGINITIKDLNITNSYIENNNNTSNCYSCSNGTGLLIGKGSNIYIEHINEDTVTVKGSARTGGLVGWQDGGTVLGVNVENINILKSINNEFYYTGGLIGYANGTVNEVVVRGNVTGHTCVGGIIGSHRGSVKKSLYARNVNVTGSLAVAGIFGDEDQNVEIYGAIENGSITDTMGTAGKAGANYSTYTGLLYSSTSVTKTGNGGIDGNTFNSNHFYLGMLDDVLDTYIGGDDDKSGYILDYENDNSNKIVVKKVDNHTFDTTITGEGTQSNPYILSTEKDFKDATLLLKGDYYFKINNDIDFSTFRHFYNLGTEKNYFSGVIDGNNKTISNLNINGGRYSGLIGTSPGVTIKNLNIINSSITNRGNLCSNYNCSNGTGFLIGKGSSINIENINANNLSVTGSSRTGGLVGWQDGGSVLAVNLKNITVTSGNNTYYTGGLIGYADGAVKEVTVRGTITGSSCVGGVIGTHRGAQKTGILSSVNVNGWIAAAGIFGDEDSNIGIYGVVESGSITDTMGTAGKVGANYSTYTGALYASTAVTKTGNGGIDGTSYSSEYIGDLNYYGSIKFDTNKPLLESPATGDINNSGYWFINDSNGDIIVVPITSSSPTPSQPVCTGNCSNPDTYPLENNTVTGTCPTGDVTPPTCTFNYFVAVTNGIRASFSCTDETSVPTVASMFNSTTKATYTFAEITDQSRGGTVKTGTVSGNTRNITSTWTTQTVPSNPPTRGTCYYYQMAAIDSCGNEGDYTTSYCYYGFSNAE